jgi:hypothetical protein
MDPRAFNYYRPFIVPITPEFGKLSMKFEFSFVAKFLIIPEIDASYKGLPNGANSMKRKDDLACNFRNFFLLNMR